MFISDYLGKRGEPIHTTLTQHYKLKGLLKSEDC